MWKATWHFLQISRVLIFSRGIDPARPQFGHARSIIETLPNRMASRASGPILQPDRQAGKAFSVLRSDDVCKGNRRALAKLRRNEARTLCPGNRPEMEPPAA